MALETTKTVIIPLAETKNPGGHNKKLDMVLESDGQDITLMITMFEYNGISWDNPEIVLCQTISPATLKEIAKETSKMVDLIEFLHI